MTQDERNKVGTMIAYTAQYYGREFKKEVIALMVSDLEDLSATDILGAYNTYRKDPRSKYFPLPAQIRDMIVPAINPEAEARELLGRIKTAITQFGYDQGSAARTYCGEVAWQLVRDHGGWFNLCNSDFLTNDSMQAQARNRITDVVKFGPRLSLVVDNQIENRSREQIEAPGLQRMGELLSKLTEKKI